MSSFKEYIKTELKSALTHAGLANNKSVDNLYVFINRFYAPEDYAMSDKDAFAFIAKYHDDFKKFVGDDESKVKNFDINCVTLMSSPATIVYWVITTQMYYALKNAYKNFGKDLTSLRYSATAALLLLDTEGYKFYDFDNEYIKANISKEMNALYKKILK